ncbi:MAG: hypothetical protein AAB546_03465 [Patescibacteria group bacterium]
MIEFEDYLEKHDVVSVSFSPDKFRADTRLELQRLGISDPGGIVEKVIFGHGDLSGSDEAVVSWQADRDQPSEIYCIFDIEKIFSQVSKTIGKPPFSDSLEMSREYLRGMMICRWLHERRHLVQFVSEELNTQCDQEDIRIKNAKRNLAKLTRTLECLSASFVINDILKPLQEDANLEGIVSLAALLGLKMGYSFLKKQLGGILYASDWSEIDAHSHEQDPLHVNPFDIVFEDP